MHGIQLARSPLGAKIFCTNGSMAAEGPRLLRVFVLLLCVVAVPALAHSTPAVVLGTDRQGMRMLLPGAKKFFAREIRLTPEERATIRKDTGWSPDQDFYRFYIARDDQHHDLGAVAFLNEFTIHGPVRVAVAIAPDGKVAGAKVMEVSEETFTWVKPLIARGVERDFVGLDARGKFTAPAGSSMEKFYANVIGGLVQRAAAIYEGAVLKRK